ncbi:PBECR3 domain-containing polyvalent protein [Anaerotignum sp.]
MSMGRNAAARSLLQSKISNSKGAFNPHTGKLKEEEEEYIPKPQREKKAAEKSAPSLRSAGMAAKKLPQTELFKNMTLPRAETKRQTQRQTQRAKVNINTDRGFVPDSQIMRQLGRTGTTFQKSTAQDEKTRLYETNDSLLNPQEILKKYSYVAQDRDMDYETLRRAVKKGMSEVGRTLRGTNDNSQYEKVAQLQTELQGRLKSASFTAGLLEGMGGAGKDALVRLSGSEALQKQNEALKAQMDAAKENNKGAAAAGQLAGELAKAGAGYMTIGKAAEEAALKGAGKLGQRMAAATAADGAQQLAAKILFDPKKAKAAGFAARMLAQQAADTAVNTPITIAAGLAEGKSREEILKDFGKQEATDAAFNLGLAGLGAGAKVAGKAFEKASKKGPILGIDFEKIKYDHARVDDGILDRIEYLKNNPSDKKIDYPLNPVNDRMAKDVGKLVGFDVSGYGNNLKPNGFDHVKKRHGSNGIHDQSMANPEDIAKVQYILDNYDDVFLDNTKSRGFTDSNGKLSKKVVFTKRINGTYYVVEAVPNTKRKRMEIVGVFKQKQQGNKNLTKTQKKENVLPGDVTSPSVTPDNATAQFSDSSIEQNVGIVNGENTAREETIQGAAAGMAEGFQSNLLGKIDYEKVSTAEVEAWNKERWRLQEIADGVPNDLNATEKNWLEGMLNGDITEVQAKKATGPRYALIKQQYDVQKPLREIEEKINGFKRYIATKRDNLAAETIGEMRMADGAQAGWKDKGTGFLYGRETQERNLRDIAPDKETADRIEQVYFAPIHENERQRTLLMKEYKDRLKGLKISTRKNIPMEIPGSGERRCSESALVQWLGESRYELQRMKAAGATEESYGELERAIQRIERGMHPNQLAKINDGIEQLRSIYEELHPMINEVLIRNGYDPIGYIPGYFPHMNFDDPTGPLETAAAKLGFDFSSKELPMDIAGRTETFRPGKRWAGNFLQRTGTKTDYDALRAFDLYIDNISDVIYHTDDIRNLRSMEDYIRYSLSDEGIQKEIEAIRKNRSLMPEEKQAKLDEIYETKMKNHKLQNYVNNLRTYTDLLAGKKHLADRNWETNVLGRKFYKISTDIENRVAGNMVAANIGSALTNFIPITQGMSNMRLSSNLKGLGEALVSMARGEMDELTKKSAFLATREGTDQLYKTTMRRISDMAGKPMEWADKFSTQAVWRSRYYDNIAKGMAEEEAIKNADEFARGLFAGRSKGAMPTAFHARNPLWKALTMFQLEVNNQISYLTKDIPRDAQGSVVKMMKAYGGLVIGAYIYNDVYEKLTGRRSALDPFGIANEAFGDLTGEQVRNTLDIIGDLAEGDGLQLTEKTEKKKGAEVYSGLKENIAENIPFIGGLMGGGRIPISSALPDFDAIGEAKANYATGEITKERKNQIVRKEFGKSLAYMAMPVAGGQIKKTVEGLNMMRKGGNYTQTNKGERLQFAVDQDKKSNWAQAALFGKWAIPEAQAHMEKKRTLSEKNTETYKKLVADGAKNTMAFETLSRVQKEEKDKEKRRVIRSSAMSEEQKAILYHSITTEDSADRRILDHYQGTAHMGKAADCLMRMADYESDKPKKYILQNTNLPDAEKKYIYLERLVDKDDREKETKRVEALMGVGISMNDYIQIRTKYGAIYNEKMKGIEKQQILVDLMNELGLSLAQQAAVKGQLIFGGGHTIDWKI